MTCEYEPCKTATWSYNYSYSFYIICIVDLFFCLFPFLVTVSWFNQFVCFCFLNMFIRFHEWLFSVTGIPQWAAPSSLPQRDAQTPSVVAERCGLASISLSDLPSGKWCWTLMVIFMFWEKLFWNKVVSVNLIPWFFFFFLQFRPLRSTKPSLWSSSCVRS